MRPDQVNEQELQLKKRARRRLVGAIALVILIVTVLPMLLHDRTSKPELQEIAITIPSQDGEDFDSKITPATQNATEVSIPANEELIANKDSRSQAQKEPKGNTVTGDKSGLTERPEEAHVKTAEKDKQTFEGVEKTSGSRAQNQTKPKLQDQKPQSQAQPQDSNKSTNKNDVNKNGVFFVQIGVFSDPVNVKQLQEKLQELGYKSHTEKLATGKGEKIRLRLNSFVSRSDAEEALANITKIGLSGMVITK